MIFPIDYFDDYSWRTFIAMVWPAAAGQRGVPDATRTVKDLSGPRVFETYKALWEVFHPDGSAPSSADYNQYEAAAHNGCVAPVEFGDIVLATVSKFDDIAQAIGRDEHGDEPEVLGALAGQNKRYVRYLAQYNSKIFDTILGNKWFLRANLPPDEASPPIRFPDNSISIKSAWLDLTGFSPAQRNRYYSRAALVRDPVTGMCSRTTVGLVGLHIVQKTHDRPQWIWSTFEQVDNVPPPPAGSAGFGFNDGTGGEMPSGNPLTLDKLTQEPTPFNVTRTHQIRDETQATNMKFQGSLEGSVWQNYQLVMTQWPKGPPGSPSQAAPVDQAGVPDNTFPGGSDTTSSFANPVFETFFQDNPRTGCMACHNSVRARGDFLWSMLTHAFPNAQSPTSGAGNAGGGRGGIQDVSLRALRTLILETQAERKSRQSAPPPPR